MVAFCCCSLFSVNAAYMSLGDDMFKLYTPIYLKKGRKVDVFSFQART
jgi:hypothetical protein